MSLIYGFERVSLQMRACFLCSQIYYHPINEKEAARTEGRGDLDVDLRHEHLADGRTKRE